MEISDRIHRAINSQMGTIFLLLLLALIVLGAFYLFLRYRQKRLDQLAYQHSRFYEEAESLLEGMTFTGQHQADIFGRTSRVLTTHRHYAHCTIPPPTDIDDEILDRYRRFFSALPKKYPLFASHLISYEEECLIVVQDGLVRRDGSSLLSLQRYLDDKRLGKAYVEQVLWKIAQALAELHRCQTEQGVALYHGFLLPRSVRLEFDVNRTIRKIVIADLGFAFAFGPNRIWEKESLLRSGKLCLDRYRKEELIDQVAMLAPEQRDDGRLSQVGPAADFYSFAALACLMFTRRRFRAARTVAWEAVPEKWRPFLQRCLTDDPKERPTDFMQLGDWLTEPSLFLAVEEQVAFPEEQAEPEKQLAGIEGVLNRLKETKESEIKEADKMRTRGHNALKLGRWEKAKESFLAVQQAQGDDGEVCLSLAIAYYELGDLDNAEKCYKQAKKLDPTTAKCFREHIAFHL